MRISPVVLLLIFTFGCGSATEPAKTPDAATVKKLLTPAQLALGEPVVNSVGMVLVPSGKFMMGSPASEPGHDDDETRHPVEITKPFYLSVNEVTQQQYEKVMELVLGKARSTCRMNLTTQRRMLAGAMRSSSAAN